MRNDVYTLDPLKVKFDDTYVKFNPLQDHKEYEATKESIVKLGQLDPILMLDDLCIDGRHRVKVAIELSEQVRCLDINPDMSKPEIIMLCNKNVMSGRDFDNTQKAIQALELTNNYGIAATEAAKIMKVDRRLVSYAATIKGYGKPDLLESLLNNKESKVQLDGMISPSRSLEILAKAVKVESEKRTVTVDSSNRIYWDPDANIKTEIGKAEYYSIVDTYNVKEVQVRMLIAELMNFRYSIQKETE